MIDDFCSLEESEDFFASLGGGSQEEVADEKVGGDDEVFEHTEEKAVTLYKVSDSDGIVKISEVAVKPLSQDLLDNNVGVCTDFILLIV